MSIAEKLTTIAENEQRVYDKGKSNGASDNLKKVWDGIQKNGKRTNYNYAFMNQSWDEETFRPNYDIDCAAETRSMFQDCDFKGSLKKALDNAGAKLDTSKCVYFYVVFYNMPNLTEAPQIDIRNVTGTMTNVLMGCQKLKRIDGIICSENTNFVSDTFRAGVTALEDCIFSGVIGKNIWLSNLTGLNHESLMSAINCLKDFGLVYFHDNPEDWREGRIANLFDGYNIMINTTIEEGKTYTVRIKDDGYGDEQNPDFTDSSIEDRMLYFYYGETDQTVGMTYADGYLEATFTAMGSLSGEFEVGIITDWSKATLGSIEIRQTPTTTKTLTLGTTLQAKLTEAEIAIATQKGWTIA